MYPEMIGDFIEKYYIDPIRYGQPYNVVDTTTYALVLILAIYIIYRWLSRSRTVRIDRDFVLATLPYLVMGGSSASLKTRGWSRWGGTTS